MADEKEVVSEEVVDTTEEIAEDEAKHLVAVSYVLYQSHQYKPGEVLPASDTSMVDAWIAAGTAAWKADEVPGVTAIPVTAQAGMTGTAVPASDEDLVGVVPSAAGKRKVGRKTK